MNSNDEGKIIGIIGGVGPYAGLDLNEKIFDQTKATADQDHLRVVLFSYSKDIPDRTEYLKGNTNRDIIRPVVKIIKQMKSVGVKVAGIPCNTFHAPSIFDSVRGELNKGKLDFELVHMIEEVGKFIDKKFRKIEKIGILGTIGTIKSKIYNVEFENRGIEVIYPNSDMQKKIHKAIYDSTYGIKTKSNPVTKKATDTIYLALQQLIEKNVQAIILGCTELPLAVKNDLIQNVPIIDATLILARALIGRAAPEKLKSFNHSFWN